MAPRIVFHGQNAGCFFPGFAELAPEGSEIFVLPDALVSESDRELYLSADVIVGARYDATMPIPEKVSLYHVPGAGYDAIDLARLPKSAIVCNCFGHEQPIAEYVFAGLLNNQIPMADADAKLRQGNWAYQAATLSQLHGEIAGKTIGLLGFGHIGKAIARRAKAFEMNVVVANRSPVATSEIVDKSFSLSELHSFLGSADYIVVSVPLTDETTGIIDAEAFSAMRSKAVIFNVGRGRTIDETALYEALRDKRIGGAVIDTWYTYPSPANATPKPGTLPFHELDNLVMTPHMSGWTDGTIRRRQQTIAENIKIRFTGGTCINVVRASE